MTELPGFIELVKALGFPGLLFGLLYLFMRLDEKKWTMLRGDDNEKWRNMGDQMKLMVTEVLANHKEERNRDFEHLRDQMEFLHGQHQTMTLIGSTLGHVHTIAIDLKKDSERVPTYVREIHGRLDKLYDLQLAEARKKEKTT